MRTLFLPLFAIMLLVFSCSGRTGFEKAAATITSDELREYTMTLGSDNFMGRKPFTEGEKKTVSYLAEELEKIGFEPLFGDSWFQSVPMVEISTKVKGAVIIDAGNESLSLSAPDEIAIESPSMNPIVDLKNIPMVFCGFGIVAPEYGWDDYHNVDVRGKCAVVLVNDPGLYTGDTTLFRGRSMTWYGRWTYKYEEAARQGAKAILIVHETLGAGYDYSIPRKSSITSSLFMEQKEGDVPPCEMTGWLHAATAENLFRMLGYDVDRLRKEACSQDFKGFEMKAAITARLENAHTRNTSVNVAGILRGGSKPDECVVITGHWDHFGIGETENGDSIYNGAVDNGTTMAWAFEIGEAFAALDKRPSRSVIILFPTAEEQGLLGSYYFTANPPIPPEKMIACFNNDMMLAIGRMKDIMVTGYGQSELDDMLAEAVEKQDRYILPDPTPETGMYFRSDHFPFARIGVPSLFARGNCDSRGNGREWAAAKEKEYLTSMYHKPADNYYPEMNFDGIAEDAAATFEVAWRIAESDIRPRWNSMSEFAKVR
ncbi:MAG: M28 family peptidase [Bacteroidales bacterium]|jgi:Zn-dependent M28 family amino/carboxypeptidase|nr:M28 family peptidase [Bacteroidales bacterium]